MAVSQGKDKPKIKIGNVDVYKLLCVQFSEPFFGGQDSKTAHPKVAY